MIESGGVPGEARIRLVSKNCSHEYRKMVESGSVPGKDRILSSTKKMSPRVLKNGGISVSTEKWKNPGVYREKVESLRVPKNYSDKY